MKQYFDTILRPLGRIRTVILAVAGGVLLFANQLEALSRLGRLSMYATATALWWGRELLLLLAIVLLWPLILRIASEASDGAIYFWRTRRQNAAYARRLAVAGVALLVALGISSYAGMKYVRAKRAQFHQLGPRLAARAGHEYLTGGVAKARFYLRTGIQMFQSYECDVELAELEERLTLATALRRAYDKVGAGSLNRPRLLLVIYSLDRNPEAYERERNLQRSRIEVLSKRYQRAIGTLASGKRTEAAVELRRIHAEFPGFADLHRLLDELKTAPAEGRAVSHPHLSAIERLGPETYGTAKLLPYQFDDTAALHTINSGAALSLPESEEFELESEAMRRDALAEIE